MRFLFVYLWNQTKNLTLIKEIKNFKVSKNVIIHNCSISQTIIYDSNDIIKLGSCHFTIENLYYFLYEHLTLKMELIKDPESGGKIDTDDVIDAVRKLENINKKWKIVINNPNYI